MARAPEEEAAPPVAAAAAEPDEDADVEDAELLAEVAEDLEAEEEEPVVLVRPEEAERLGDLDALGTYLREIGRYPLLNAAQEVELAKRIEGGVKASKRLAKDGPLAATKKREVQRTVRDGEMAKHDMVQANLRLVVSIARRYRATGIPLLDL